MDKFKEVAERHHETVIATSAELLRQISRSLALICDQVSSIAMVIDALNFDPEKMCKDRGNI